MSVMNRKGEKIVLPRQRNALWAIIHEAYAGADRQAWRRLAMLTLSEAAEWPVERIASTFGQKPGQVERSVREAKFEIRRRVARSGRGNGDEGAS